LTNIYHGLPNFYEFGQCAMFESKLVIKKNLRRRFVPEHLQPLRLDPTILSEPMLVPPRYCLLGSMP